MSDLRTVILDAIDHEHWCERERRRDGECDCQPVERIVDATEAMIREAKADALDEFADGIDLQPGSVGCPSCARNATTAVEVLLRERAKQIQEGR